MAAALSSFVLLAPAAHADPGDLVADGCFRDIENTGAGCTAVQGLDRAYGASVSPDGRQVFIASAEDDSLTVFNRDASSGALSYVSCLRDATRAALGCTSVDGLDGARGVVTSSDGRSVYVAAADGDALAVFNRNPETGSVAYGGCFRDVESLVAGCADVPAGLHDAMHVTVTADGGFVYVAAALDDAITTFKRDTATGGLTWQGCVRDTANPATGCTKAPALTGPRSVEVSPDGRTLVVAAKYADAVTVFDRDVTSGGLTFRSCVRDTELAANGCTSGQGLDNPHGVSFSPDGTSIYIPNEIDDSVATFTRDAAGAVTYTGCLRDSALAANGCTSAEGLDGARQIDVSADGTSVYVAAADDDAVTLFDRNPSTGALTWDSCTRDADRAAASCALHQGLDGARGVAVSDDGRSVYIGAELDDSAVAFDREQPPAPDTTAPTVAWAAPASGATVSGTLSEAAGTCLVDAADDRALARVEFLVDGQPLAPDASAPYGCQWDTRTATNGAHTLTAIAIDAAGNRAEATRTVSVDNTVPNAAPTVTLTSPANGSTFKNTLNFAAAASDDGGVTRVEFLVDGALAAVDSTAPYAVTWSVPKKMDFTVHTITARAYDAQGLTASSSVRATRAR